MATSRTGEPFDATVDGIEVGNIYQFKNGDVAMIDYRNGPTIGILWSNGSQGAWSHQQCAERFLAFRSAKLIGAAALPENADRETLLLVMLGAIARRRLNAATD